MPEIEIGRAIHALIHDARENGQSLDQLVVSLKSELAAGSYPSEDLESAVGAMRVAVEEYIEEKTGGSEARCNFCGLPRSQVPDLISSSEANICTNCAIKATDELSKSSPIPQLRMAFRAFEGVFAILNFFAKPWQRKNTNNA
jgi:hypothetical protein